MFKDYGWEYIQDLNEFSYFCKLDDGSGDEIFSDIPSRIDMLERINRHKMMPLLAVFLYFSAFQLIRIVSKDIGNDAISMVLLVIWMLLMLLYIYVIARCVAGFSKLRKKYDVK